MKKFTLTTRLNIKVICIISVFMITITVYNQWMAFQDKEAEYAAQLEAITDYIIKKIPASTFDDIAGREAESQETIEEQAVLINNEIQPFFENILLTSRLVKYGFYSKEQQRIMAIGPELDQSLLIHVERSALSTNIYDTEEAHWGRKSQSIVWYGKDVLYHVRPVMNDGQVIGHVFACLNLDRALLEVWASVIKTLTTGFLALLIVIMLFQEVFIQFKKELELFAESIVAGRSKMFESKIPELTPILHYISEQTESIARLDRLNIVGEMAASIGHEVRNPMTTVRGFLQFLGNKPSYRDSREHFNLMISEMDRANKIITEFLALAKNKAMDFKSRDLNEVITNITPLLESDAVRSNCQLKLDLQAVTPVRLDDSSMRQLILNLVRNAIESMKPGGTVKISTTQRNEKVELSIQDQGGGIKPEIIHKLGTPFITTKENGIGIGLAVCYRIVQRHEGEIRVTSAVGQGTTFTITLNAAGDAAGQTGEVKTE